MAKVRAAPVTAAQLRALTRVLLPDGRTLRLGNVDLAHLTHTSTHQQPNKTVNARAVSRWLNGKIPMPLSTYELLCIKLHYLRHGWVTLEELCSGRLLHELTPSTLSAVAQVVVPQDPDSVSGIN